MIWTGILQGWIAAIAYFVALLILLRLTHRFEAAFVALAAAAGTYLLTLALLLAIGQTVNFWVFSTTYWFLALCFLMAFGAIYKSLSLRVLLELVKSPDRTESVEALRVRYIFGDSFKDRLELVVERGLAVEMPQGLSLTPRGLMLADRVRAMQRVFGIMRSG